jgi:hypothetical protein
MLAGAIGTQVIRGVTKGESFDHGQREQTLWEGVYINRPMIYPIQDTSSEYAWDMVLASEKVNPIVLQILPLISDMSRIVVSSDPISLRIKHEGSNAPQN